MTIEEMEDTLSRLGIETYNVRGVEIQALCPAHEERTGRVDRNPSWFINADTGAHICFSCGWKGNVYSLISYVTKTDYENASSWLGSADGLVKRLERAIQEKTPVDNLVVVSESMLKAFVAPPDYALQARGFTVQAAAKYELLWDARASNWIVPIRDAKTGELMGWQEKGFDRRYFNNRPAGVKKSETLFGYQHVTDSAILVESPLDVVRLASLGYVGMASYGSSVSLIQFNLIRSLPKLIFAMDNDESGRGSSKNLLKLSTLMHTDARFFNYSNTDMKDVGGMSADEIRWGIDNSRHIVRGEKAI